MDGDSMKRVQVCPECGLTVVWTFMFAGAEWYCPVCEWAGGMFYAVQAPATAELIGLQKRITARFHRAQNKVLPTTAYRRDCDKCDSGRGEYHCRHADADELRADEVGRRWLKNMVGAYKLQGKFST